MDAPSLMAAYQLRQREYLLRITRAMNSRLDLPSLLRLILASAAELVAAPAGLIVLYEEDEPVEFDESGTRLEGGRLRIRAYYGFSRQLLPTFRPLLEFWPVPGSRAELQDNEALLDRYRYELEERVREVEAHLGRPLGQVIGLPLVFEEELLGIIYLFRTGSAFTHLDWEFLQGFADQAAIAVRNARLYQQLARERGRLAAIIDNSINGFLILTPGRRVEVINQALAAMLGLSKEEVVGRPCDQVLRLQNVAGDNLCDEPDLLPRLLESPLRCEGDIPRPDGSHISVAVTYTPLFDERGRLANIIGNVVDITPFREEEEIKSTFVSIISHELKTPVAIIKGYAQTLARPDAEWDPETARQGLQVIEEEADRLETLIDTLLDVSRIQAGGLKLDLAEVDLARLLERIVAAYRTQTERHCIELDLPPDLPVIVGDEERLRQVFTNLLSNAIKYSPEGGTIRIGGWVEEDPRRPGRQRAVIYVADQGIGIPESELPHIFDRFYRGDTGLRRRTSGVGLGLYLVHAIVEAHQGEIWIRSEVGKGTTVFVALPVDERE